MPSLNPRNIFTGERPGADADMRKKTRAAKKRTRRAEEKAAAARDKAAAKTAVAKRDRAPTVETQARSYIWRRRLRTVRRLGFAALVMVIVGGGWWSWKSGEAARVWAQIEEALPQVSDMPGLTVAQIEVSGNTYLTPEAVSAALDIGTGNKIADLDLADLQARVEALGWVKSARVSRLLPGTIRVDVTERLPYALWQFEGELRLVDAEGVEVTRERLNRFATLPLVVGAEAPPHAAALQDMLATEPEMAARVEAAVRVGARRWDLKFTNGVTVKLPEEDVAAAWARLAELERNQGILGRDIAALDMRLPDRLIVRLTPAAAKARRAAEDDRT